MARLPQPGGDSGNWGVILNDYLQQAHKTDGTLRDNSVAGSTIAAGAVGSTQLATDSIDASKIEDGSITEILLDTGVQTKLNASPTLADGSVTKTKLSSSLQTSIDKADTSVQPSTSPILTGVRLTSGSPTSGKVWSAMDSLGNGSWSTASNVEIAYAELATASAIATSMTDVPGLAITLATDTRPVMIEAYLSGVYGTADGTFQFQIVRTSDNAVMALGVSNTSVSVGYPPAPQLKFRVPAGTASTTYKVQAQRIAGTAAGQINPGAKKAYIQGVAV